MAAILQHLGGQQPKHHAEQGARVKAISAGRLAGQIERLDQQAVQLDMYLAFDRGQQPEIDEVELVAPTGRADRLGAVDGIWMPTRLIPREQSGQIGELDLFERSGRVDASYLPDSHVVRIDDEQQRRAVKVSASILTSDPWQEACQILPDVNTLTRNAATQAYEQAGVGPGDLDLVELHDCFATAELVHYDNLMLCEEGGAVDFFESGAPWRDGRMPVNVSGGLQSKGHPISATGIANIWEVAQHVRGEGGPRQIEGAKVGLAHVIGLGSACGIHILEKSGLAAA